MVELHEGQELDERIRLVRPLTQGGMAQLWVAEHRTLGIDVVVKIMTPKAAQETTAKLRFMREARVTAKLRSPHVAHVLDYHEGTVSQENDAFLVMELLQGEDLSARIMRKGQLSVGETLTIVEHVALALESAHRLGVVHRDVKPENVFLVEEGEDLVAKLLDFGIAKDASEEMLELTRADALMGTPHYMSPEQMVGARDVDWRCDVWSLSVLAYACLTGRTPFDGATFGAVCVAIHRGVFTAPSLVRPGLSASIDVFFAKALCLTIGLRHQSARALADAFQEAAAADVGVEARLQEDATRRETLPEARLADGTTLLELDALEELPKGRNAPGAEENLVFDLERPRSVD